MAIEKPLHTPGVYFGLEESRYRADPALGSTDMKRLAYSPCDYWFGSVHNPHREPEESTNAQGFGLAIHKFVLEGREAFESLYAPTEFSGTTKDGKAERAAILEEGKTPIRRDEWDRIQMAGAMIRANPAISSAFSGGMSEVSVFWERDGIRRKARFDYLKARAVVDLKSAGNQRSEEFSDACKRAIATYRYDVQSSHYGEARNLLREFVAAGAVHGDHDPEWLARVAQAQESAFVFIFFQSKGAPVTWGTTISPGNGTLDLGSATISRAERHYKEFSERFGFDQPWTIHDPLEELDVNQLPAWAFKK